MDTQAKKERSILTKAINATHPAWAIVIPALWFDREARKRRNIYRKNLQKCRDWCNEQDQPPKAYVKEHIAQIQKLQKQQTSEAFREVTALKNCLQTITPIFHGDSVKMTLHLAIALGEGKIATPNLANARLNGGAPHIGARAQKNTWIASHYAPWPL